MQSKNVKVVERLQVLFSSLIAYTRLNILLKVGRESIHESIVLRKKQTAPLKWDWRVWKKLKNYWIKFVNINEIRYIISNNSIKWGDKYFEHECIEQIER